MKKFLENLRKETLEQKWGYYRVPLYVSTNQLKVLKKVGDVVCTPRINRAKEAMTGDKLTLLYDNQILRDSGNKVIHLLYNKERLCDFHDKLIELNGFAAFVCESDFDDEHRITNQEMIEYCDDFANSSYNKVISQEEPKTKIKK